MTFALHSLWNPLVFRLIILALVLGLQWLLFSRAYRWARTSFPSRRWIAGATIGVFAIFNLAFLAVLFVRPRAVDFPAWFRNTGMYPFYLWFAATFLLGVFVLAVGIVKLPFLAALWAAGRSRRARTALEHLREREDFQRFNAGRRVFLRRGMQGLTVAAFAGSAYGMFVEREVHDLTEAEYEIEGLDPAFDGFVIGLVTDVHSSIFMSRKDMDGYVAALNLMKPDIVVVGGDFVNSLTDEVYPFAESFSNLKTREGSFGVMGNHDFYASEPERVAREVNDCGVRLLRDERTTLKRGSAELHLVGIDDVGSPARARDRMVHAMGSSPLRGPKILLCHRPYFLPQAAETRFDLMLSGHTHGGQLVLASLGKTVITPAALFSPYVSGEYREGNTVMYVSRGIGTVAIPVRLNCPPEITRIVLRSPRSRRTSTPADPARRDPPRPS